MIAKIDHIGIAVSSLDDALKIYRDILGLKVEGIEVLEGDIRDKSKLLELFDTHSITHVIHGRQPFSDTVRFGRGELKNLSPRRGSLFSQNAHCRVSGCPWDASAPAGLRMS